MTMNTNKSYSELNKIDDYESRFEYLKIGGKVGEDTFGHDRYLNQTLYKSKKWKNLRDEIIVRDDGCDMGIKGRNIHGTILVHHINPITRQDILNGSDKIYDPNNLISVSLDTHNAIHFGDSNYLKRNTFEERTPNDTSPWIK